MPAATYLSPPQTCERTREIASRFGGTWTETSSRERVRYQLPNEASAEVRAFWTASSTLELEPRFVARIPGGRVFGVGAVLSPDGKSVARDVSVDFGRSPEEHWLLSYSRIRLPESIAGVTAVAATALGHGYAHWLLEELPRLLALRDADFEHVITHESAAFARAARPFLSLKAETIFPRRLNHWACDELVVPSLFGPPGFPTPGLVEELNRFGDVVAPSSNAGIGLPEKIYVSRAKAKRRSVTNETELWLALKARGFTKVHLEELSWARQIQIFRSAKEIVGAHGAGLANLVFCRPGVRVGELFHRGWMNGCYWRLSSAVGLDYCPFASQGDSALAERLEANGDPVVADIGSLLRWLSGS